MKGKVGLMPSGKPIYDTVRTSERGSSDMKGVMREWYRRTYNVPATWEEMEEHGYVIADVDVELKVMKDEDL